MQHNVSRCCVACAASHMPPRMQLHLLLHLHRVMCQPLLPPAWPPVPTCSRLLPARHHHLLMHMTWPSCMSCRCRSARRVPAACNRNAANPSLLHSLLQQTLLSRWQPCWVCITATHPRLAAAPACRISSALGLG